jgi:hypothetical protein
MTQLAALRSPRTRNRRLWLVHVVTVELNAYGVFFHMYGCHWLVQEVVSVDRVHALTSLGAQMGMSDGALKRELAVYWEQEALEKPEHAAASTTNGPHRWDEGPMGPSCTVVDAYLW